MESLLAVVSQAETDQRGYWLTGNDTFLGTFVQTRDGIAGRLAKLRGIIAIDEARASLDALSPLIASKFAFMEQVLSMRRKGDMAAVIAAVSEGGGRRLMDSIRAEGAKLMGIEENALTRNEAEFRLKVRALFVVIIASSMLSLLCALSLVYSIYREKRRKLEEGLNRETLRLLDLQRDNNRELQLVNAGLQISEEKLAVTLNSIGDAVLATDAQGLITLLNPVAEQLTGWTIGEAAGHSFEEVFRIINQETRRAAAIPITATLAHGTVHGLANHTLLLSRSDREYAIADSCAPIRGHGGQVVGAVLVFRDVTDEYSAREYSESIINTVREPLISLDQDLRVVSVSRSFYEVFKVKPEETLGQLIYDLGNKQWDIPKLRELLETILPQKASFDNYVVEHDFATIGKRIMLLNARQIRRGAGKERIILLAIEDITERREIEAGLEKAHADLNELATELKRAARIKSEFLANMSHELRTPLNSINGFSEVLYDETFGKLNDKQKRYVNNVLTSGKHLLLLINQILDMAKVEAGKMTLTTTTVSPKHLLNEITRLVADMAGKKRIRMSLEIAEDIPEIEADELKLREVLYNLFSNAVKFTPEGGELGLRAKRADSAIEICVWDTGVGIARENLEKVFEGFFRVDTPYSRVTEGTGLGLPLSRKLIELHGGTLSVESEGLNKGTSVRFTLPIKSGKAQ
jgi:two-component system CheB/CheR fusion protein